MREPPFPLVGGLTWSPQALPRETMSSWLLRTAAAHGMPWGQMIALLDQADIKDPDFEWPWELESSAQFFAVPSKVLKRMLVGRWTYLAATESYSLLRGAAKNLRFGACVECFRQWKTLHYTLESRFGFIRLCRYHATPLRTVGHGVVSDGDLQRILRQLDALPMRESGDWSDERLVDRLILEDFYLNLAINGWVPDQTMAPCYVDLLLAYDIWQLRDR